MVLQAQFEGSEGSAQTATRLRRSGAIALVFMVDQPYFRRARGEPGPTGPQAPFAASALHMPADRNSIASLPYPAGAQGLGLFGDTVLESDLAA